MSLYFHLNNIYILLKNNPSYMCEEWLTSGESGLIIKGLGRHAKKIKIYSVGKVESKRF